MQKVNKYILVSLGILSVCLGVIGMFVPLLPTVPFLLLASYLFKKSSERLNTWLVNHNVLGKYISNYQNNRAVTIKTKIMSISLLWLSLVISSVLINNIHVYLLFLVLGSVITIYTLRLKTMKN